MVELPGPDGHRVRTFGGIWSENKIADEQIP
jgi:hypothetical protein